jgi:hypothetical protein
MGSIQKSWRGCPRNDFLEWGRYSGIPLFERVRALNDLPSIFASVVRSVRASTDGHVISLNPSVAHLGSIACDNSLYHMLVQSKGKFLSAGRDASARRNDDEHDDHRKRGDGMTRRRF